MNDTTKTPAPSGSPITPAEELLRAGKALGSAILPPEPFHPYAIVPDGFRLEQLPLRPLLPLPDHIRQAVRLDDAASFIAYVKAFRKHTTRIFAAAVKLAEVSAENAGGAKFTALLDYHEGGTEQKAARVAHVAEYPVPLSLEFSTWIAANGKPFTQMGFVEFIEQNCADVVSPDSATLMELALNFEAKSNVTFQSKVDRVTGGRSLTYQEQVDAGAPSVGQVKVPESLAIRIPVFEGGKGYDFKARLEYRPSNGRLAITYHLQRPQEAFRAAIKDLREEIAEALEAQILTGSPDLASLRAEQGKK